MGEVWEAGGAQDVYARCKGNVCVFGRGCERAEGQAQERGSKHCLGCARLRKGLFCPLVIPILGCDNTKMC